MELKDLLEGTGVTIVGGLVVEEFNAEAPRFASRVTRFATSILPIDMRERLTEEWFAYLSETPGKLNKVRASLGFVCTSYRLAVLPQIAAFSRIVAFFALNPWLVLYVCRFLQNYPRTVRKARLAGWDVPWSPIELGWSGFWAHQKDFTKSGQDTIMIAPISEWMISNKIHALVIVQLAGGVKVSQLFRRRVLGRTLVHQEQ